MATKSNSPAKGIEINDDQPIVETVAESRDFRQLAADEAFMNEMVTIMVHSTPTRTSRLTSS